MYRRNQPVGVGQPQPKQQVSSKPPQILAQWQSALNLISHLLKNHSNQSLFSSFSFIKRQQQLKKKYGSFLSNKLHLLQRRKDREYLKVSFSALVSNRISFYVSQKQQHDEVKNNLKNKATALIIAIGHKLQLRKGKEHFTDLRTRAALKAKLGAFKHQHLASLMAVLLKNRVRMTWSRIELYGRHRLSSLRRLSRLEKTISNKQRHLLLHGLLKLRVNLIKLKQASEKGQASKEQVKEESKPVVQPAQPLRNDRQLEGQIRKLQTEQRTLNDKKRSLEQQLKKAETDGKRNLDQFRKELERLQAQNSELVFNHDLLEQNNQELQRQLEIKQKGGRKKLSKAQIWENVYNHLLHFLATHKDQPVTRQQLLDCLEVPLVPCGLNLQDLQEENQILGELLEEYKKNFPAPASSSEGGVGLPFEVVRKQNRYYYMVLEVLSEWGLPGSKELEQLNSDLAHIQKKLTP